MKLRERIARWLWTQPAHPPLQQFILTDKVGPKSRDEWRQTILAAEPFSLPTARNFATIIAAEFDKRQYEPPTTIYFCQAPAQLGVLAVLAHKHIDDAEILRVAVERARGMGQLVRMLEVLYLDDMLPADPFGPSLRGHLNMRVIRGGVGGTTEEQS